MDKKLNEKYNNFKIDFTSEEDPLFSINNEPPSKISVPISKSPEVI